MLETLTGFALKGFRCSSRAPSGEQLAVFPLILRGGGKNPTIQQQQKNPTIQPCFKEQNYIQTLQPLNITAGFKSNFAFFHHIATVVTRQH